MARTLSMPALLGAAALFLPTAGRADAAAETRLRDALRSTTAQVRALEDEAATSKAKEAALQKEVEALRAQAKAAPAPKRPDRELSELRQKLGEQTEANRSLIESAVKCQAVSRERAEASRACEGEREKLAPRLSSCAEGLGKAEAKNERLFRVGKEIINWLSSVGVGGAIAAREPFLGLKRVELENAAQDLEEALYEQRLVPAGGEPAGASPPGR
ncbi:MAG TPA: hypothetical protein VF875_15220 [Anaeromyxobacter sp.]